MCVCGGGGGGGGFGIAAFTELVMRVVPVLCFVDRTDGVYVFKQLVQ